MVRAVMPRAGGEHTRPEPAAAATGAALATEAANSHDVTNVRLPALISIRGVDDERRILG